MTMLIIMSSGRQCSILIKQLSELAKNPLPNISAISQSTDITKLDIIFYYKKSSSEDINPYFLPAPPPADSLRSAHIHAL